MIDLVKVLAGQREKNTSSKTEQVRWAFKQHVRHFNHSLKNREDPCHTIDIFMAIDASLNPPKASNARNNWKMQREEMGIIC
jgi:hypothetical protein